MNSNYKPVGYNSVSPYFIVEGAQKFIDFLDQIFVVKKLRHYERPDGTIMHAEVQIDDSVIMLSEATRAYPAVPMVMHVYVPDVDTTFERVVSAGCDIIEPPHQQDDDSDKRGTFKDFAGNIWSVATQMPSVNE